MFQYTKAKSHKITIIPKFFKQSNLEVKQGNSMTSFTISHGKNTNIIIITLVSLLLLLYNNVLVNSNGLTMRLIHPDSTESPFYQENISYEERIRSLVSQTNIKASSLLVQPKIERQVFHYIIKIGIGTFKTKPPYIEYYLEMDSCSSLVWTQCEGCTKCFKQTPKPFPKGNSSSFNIVLNGNDSLRYELTYADGSHTHGILAKETIHVRSKNGSMAKIENFQFGCGLNNNMQYGNHKNNKITGIMGLGWGDLSFVNQISRQSNGKFSYCLPVYSKKNLKNYLRFGNDVLEPRTHSSSTPLYREGNTASYYVDLIGISVNENRLRINSKNFEIGGCIIDSGTPYSAIITPAFETLKKALEKYFSEFKNLKRIKGDLGLELCYERSKSEGFRNMPDVTLHFKGRRSDFVMKPEAVFEVVKRTRGFRVYEYFCLAMVRNGVKTTIGSHQQTNQRIVYDTKNKELMFYKDDCSRNF